MSFLDFTNLISDDQLSALAELNAEKAAAGEPMITLLDIMADDSVLDDTGISTLDSSNLPPREDVQASVVQENRPPPVETVSVVETGTFNPNKGKTLGALDISKLADYGEGSSVVLAPDGVGVIRNGKYINPSETNMSGSERNDIFSQAERNTKLLLAQQELEVNGTPIAETLGLKQPGDKNYDGEDRERIQEAENAAEVLLREQSNLDYHQYLAKKNETNNSPNYGFSYTPSAPTNELSGTQMHNQMFGGSTTPGTVKQDENGNWYAVKQLDNSNAFGRDYSIDPKDNSQGPTFGKNVSKDIEEMFPTEVAAAGGSSDFEGSIKDIFKDTDVDSLGYDAATGTYSTPEPVVTEPVETDIAQPGDLDLDDDISIDPVSELAQKYVDAGLDDMSGLDLLAEETGTETGFTPTGYTFEAVEDFEKDQDKFRLISDVYDNDDYAKMLEDDSDTYNELTPEGKAALDAKVVDLATSVLDDLDSEVGQTTTEDAIEALKARIGSPYDTNVSAAEVAATLGLIQGTPITSNELDALMPEYDFFKPDAGTQLLLEGSGALTSKMIGNLISAAGDVVGSELVSEAGEDLRAQGDLAKFKVIENLTEYAPETLDALNRPIMGDDGFDLDALAAKAYFSSTPTILGLAGIPFGTTAALVTGGIMTAAEVGTEARDDTYNTAIEMGYSEAEAETLSRSASITASAIGLPLGAISNVLFSTILPGSGAGSIATVAANMVEEAVSEGYIEQNVAAYAVDEELGTNKLGKAYSIDEGIVGALIGGGVTIATINNAINKAIVTPAPPGGETSTGGPSATDLATASEILNSGADVSIVTDSNGDLIITDTGTGQSVNVGSVISSSVPISGSETTAANLTAAEQAVASGASDVTVVSKGGNITLTNNKTGFTAVVTPSSSDSTSLMNVITAVETNDSTGVTNAGATVSTGTDGTGITTLVPGTTDTTGTNTGVTTTAGADSTTTTVGVGSTETITSGDTQITTSVDANGNTTVMTTNTNTGVGETTTVPAGSNTTISSGVTEITVNATNTGTTTTAVTNTGTNVPAAVTETATNVPAAVTNTTDVGTLTTFTEEDDFTEDPIFVPPTEFTPGGDDNDTTDDEVPPVGEQDPGYTSGIAGLSGARPTVAPYYQPQQTGQYSFYVPQPGVDQTVPAGPVMSDPTSYLAPTANPQYGYGYIAPNAELEYLRRLAEIQGTGAEKLPSENLMDGS